MDKLKAPSDTLRAVRKAFERSLNLYQSQYSTATQAEREAYIASVVKHFELVYEVLVQFLRALLVRHGIKASGSKKIFRACYQKEFIDRKTFDDLLAIARFRNATSPLYDEDKALSWGNAAITHYIYIKNLLETNQKLITL